MVVLDSNAEPVTTGDQVYSSKDRMVWEIIGFIGNCVVLQCGPSQQSIGYNAFALEFCKVKD